MDITSLLLSHQDMDIKYQELEASGFQHPYIYTIRHNNKVVYFIGSSHQYTYTHKQFDVIQKLWKEFLQESKLNKRVVLIEGGVRPLEDFIETAVTGTQ